MCFSPAVSFVSGAVLISIGAATLNANYSRPQFMLNSMPLLFGAQQVAEGFVWRELHNSSVVGATPAVLSFLGFALVIWPAWVPWSVYNIETIFWRKKVLLILGGLGIGVGLSTLWLLLKSGPEAYPEGHSIGYRFSNWVRVLPANFEFASYILTSLFPFFFSSKAWVKTTGTLIFLGMVLAMIVRERAVTSVWCFFAAIVSVYIAWHVYFSNRVFASKAVSIKT